MQRVIGTVGFFINGEKQQTAYEQLTTLQAKELHPILKQCVRKGVTHVVLEASSMGLRKIGSIIVTLTVVYFKFIRRSFRRSWRFRSL